MSKNKPKRTKDQLIIDPLIESLCNIIQRLTKENKELKAEIVKICAVKKKDIGKGNTKGGIEMSRNR